MNKNKHMKRQKIYNTAAILCIINCALCIIIGCTSDEQSTGNGNGEPIVFTATGIVNTPSRSTTDGDWQGVSGVAVQIGGDVKEYTLSSLSTDYKTATLAAPDGTTPFYWDTNEKTVTAWYPYSEEYPSSLSVKADQSGNGYANSDMLKATKDITINDNSLVFAHQVAKIVINVDISSLPSTAKLNGATLSDINGVEDRATEIAMHQSTTTTVYEALVVPQSTTTPTITLSTENLGTYVYTFDKVDWKAANTYTYTLSIESLRLVLTGTKFSPWISETKDNGTTMTPSYPDYTIKDVNSISGNVLDKTILTGTTTNGITIAAGANVVLYNVNINTSTNSAIKCLGDVNIYVEGTNIVRSNNDTDDESCCGIEAGGKNTNIIIDGNGSLDATGGEYGAAIGSGNGASCGDITINGGTVTATGGWAAAGIGSGYISSCGNITINGGTVYATSWGIPSSAPCGAGIGSGCDGSSCGNITINGGTVTATSEVNGAGIGSGRYSSCGDITISGGTVTAISDSYSSAGIGTGDYGKCQNITIKSDVDKVIVSSIGLAENGSFVNGGSVTIEDGAKSKIYEEDGTTLLYTE